MQRSRSLAKLNMVGSKPPNMRCTGPGYLSAFSVVHARMDGCLLARLLPASARPVSYEFGRLRNGRGNQEGNKIDVMLPGLTFLDGIKRRYGIISHDGDSAIYHR
jgi:hypothetical protein